MTRIRAFGKYLCLGTLAFVVAWLLLCRASDLLVSSVPGCRLGAKGFPINCGSATGLISLINNLVFFGGIVVDLAALPCLLLGASIWAWASWNRASRE